MANRKPMSIVERYGCTLRIYDYGSKYMERYTMVPPRWARQYVERSGLFECIGASEHLGIAHHTSAAPGPHLGKRLHWNELPVAVQRFARQCYPEFCPPVA
ncbi:hypothetical protein HNP46_000319 [Pseudomonas nitritireducens]|uniref:Uncharacterized protein n=1 Tax=Pseudomonas nitroreducens TaxID=46680 RepID=A0A7W7KFV1_PSENT|nr:hypothetical protein [Pseudomonas nitritireducens]MBB4861508.1 hypothetical protein [Pseudomonas nitritireducens]